jgi:hypothetical protein
MKLSLEESDREWLSELNCYIREHCVEVFSATKEDVAASPKSGRIIYQQVGLRCVYCKDHKCDTDACSVEGGNHGTMDENDMEVEMSKPNSVYVVSPDKGDVDAAIDNDGKANAAVSFPTAVSGIYESVKRWQLVHLPVCGHIPMDVKAHLGRLSNSNGVIPTAPQYWADSARALGLVDTSKGIRFSRDPKFVRLLAFQAGKNPNRVLAELEVLIVCIIYMLQ